MTDYNPKIYVLKKDIPGLLTGAWFQQSYHKPNVYFHSKSEKYQVRIIEFESRYVESNTEWFEEFIDLEKARYCCYIPNQLKLNYGCMNQATYEIWMGDEPTPDDYTDSCSEHLEEMLDDSIRFEIFRIQ